MSEVYTSRSGEFRFNDLVVMEMLFGVPDEKRIGRLVQVRKGVGAFNMDLYFIRLRDGGLATFENVMMRRADDKRFEDAFYRSNGQEPPRIPEQPVNEDDAADVEYSIGGKWPEVGFLIEKPAQPKSEVQSFTMMIMHEKESP